MSRQGFALRVIHEPDSVSIFCAGEIDVATQQSLSNALDIALESRPSRIVFDGSGISFMASCGAEALLRLTERCWKLGVRLDAVLSPPARRVLDLVGLWWIGVAMDPSGPRPAGEDATFLDPLAVFAPAPAPHRS